ncbi:MAG TPA: hypothetical protein PLK37_07695 [Terricaulis sp.]|nr:hypothetical protein [Terricaulis sp.]
MRHPPIPQRIAPLAWRKPAYFWTPLALALAIGGPYLAFGAAGALAHLALVAGAFVYALALASLGFAWAFGRAPRARREVVLHVVAAGAISALAAPYVMTLVLGATATQGDEAFSLPMALSVTPLALLLGLPIALISGIAFAWVALRRAPLDDAREQDARFEVQPFR